jgi:hypothetical protein
MRFIVFALAALVALSVFAVRTLQQPIEAAPVEFTVQLTGDQEIPPANGGTAVAKFTWNDDNNILTYEVTASSVPPNTANAAHFHRGAPGSNGPIIPGYCLFGCPIPGPTFTTIRGEFTLGSQDEAELKKGEWFVNVHSEGYPSGFARGQMIVPGTEGATRGAPTPAANVTSPNTGEGSLADSASGANWIPAAVVAALVLVPGVWLLARRRA